MPHESVVDEAYEHEIQSPLSPKLSAKLSAKLKSNRRTRLVNHVYSGSDMVHFLAYCRVIWLGGYLSLIMTWMRKIPHTFSNHRIIIIPHKILFLVH